MQNNYYHGPLIEYRVFFLPSLFLNSNFFVTIVTNVTTPKFLYVFICETIAINIYGKNTDKRLEIWVNRISFVFCSFCKLMFMRPFLCDIWGSYAIKSLCKTYLRDLHSLHMLGINAFNTFLD